MDKWSSSVIDQKQNFGQIIKMSLKYVFGIITFVRMIHYMFYGRRIVHLLDDQCFASSYRKHVSQKAALKWFISSIAFLNFRIIFSNFNRFILLITNYQSLTLILKLISSHVYLSLEVFEIIILFYYQWLTKRTLSDILKLEHFKTGK